MKYTIEEGRKPVQARSKQRVKLILDTAIQMILDENVEALSMNELAHNANLPVGSVYQYFPSKRALLKSLLEDHLALINKEVNEILNSIVDKETLVLGIRKAINATFEIAYGNDLGQKLWAGTQYDPALRKIQDDDGQSYAQTLANKFAEILGIEVTEKFLIQCSIYIASMDACLRSVIDAKSETQHKYIQEIGDLILRELKLPH